MSCSRTRLVAPLLLLLACPHLANAQGDCPPGALSFPSTLLNALDENPLDASTREAVVLIHGWTAKDTVAPDYNRYEDAADAPQMNYLYNILKLRLTGSSTTLVAYRWERDASTGDIWDFNLVPPGMDPGGYGNAVEAAVNARDHGGCLGTLLNLQSPDLRVVQFIAHSAGSWAAREAAATLLALNPYVVVQITLLDPFIPDENILGGDSLTGLNTALMSATASLPGAERIHRLQNYYADDAPCGVLVCWNPFDSFLSWPVGPTISTQETFTWRSSGYTGQDANRQVDWGLALGFAYSLYYDFHSGPVEFYADTVDATISFPHLAAGLEGGLLSGPIPFDYQQTGWYRSIFYEEFLLPKITVQPLPQSVRIGQPAILSVTALRATLPYQWFKNRQPLQEFGSTLTLDSVSAGDEGEYVVRVSNDSGQVFSEKAALRIESVQVAGVVPSTGSAQGGTPVAITGTGFQAGAVVTIGGVGATSVAVVNATTITAVTGAHAAGVVDVVVTNAGATPATLIGGYTYVTPALPPTVSTVTPMFGSTTGGTAITITGTGFAGPATITVGGVAATSVTVVNSTTMTATTPTHLAGVTDISVTVPAGSATLTGGFEYRAVADNVRSVVAGGGYTCVLTVAGGVQCWGLNDVGQLGDGTTISRSTPTPVIGLGSGVTAISAGASGSHTCALTISGGVRCWGANGSGQLGDGTTTHRLTPAPVIGLGRGVAAISANGRHTCALTTAGAMKCWGDSYWYQLGDPTAGALSYPVVWWRTTPTPVSGLASGVAGISVGSEHTCAVTTAGAMKCWGLNLNNQLGVGSYSNYQMTPTPVVGLDSGVAAFAAGQDYTCAVTTAGGMTCWGYGLWGQLGNGSQGSNDTPAPVIGLESGVAALSVGTQHTCALTTGGSVKCWGWNEFGQLGNGGTTYQDTPTQVSGLGSGAAAVAVGSVHTCAVTAGGGVLCWGANGSGQLGDGTTTNRITPTSVTALGLGAVTPMLAQVTPASGPVTGGTAVTIGGVEFMAGATVTIGGTAATGVTVLSATTITAMTPAHVSGAVDVVVRNPDGQEGSLTGGFTYGAPRVLAAGGSNHSGHTCVVTAGGGVKCWGDNSYGQLGDGTTTKRSTPTAVSGLENGVVAIAVGAEHSCALSAGGGVVCWGNNSSGQLGDGTTTLRLTPVPVIGLESGATAIATGTYHTCALTTVGGVMCWGSNPSGQLGDGTTTMRKTPTAVSGLSSGVAAIAASGSQHTCALTTTGGAFCWGLNSNGQLGDGTTTSRSTPVPVSGLGSDVAAIVAGGWHTCIVTTGGTAACWGANGGGQLGDGTTTQRLTPVPVSGLSSGVAALAAGPSQTCALTTGGGLVCWGSNGNGELGDGTMTSRSTPAPVNGLESGVEAVAVGRWHSCALTTGGGVDCWGKNEFGQLGDGTASLQRETPVAVSGFGSGVAAVAAGGSQTCVLTTGGSVACSGGNYNGQLGDGTTAWRSTLTAVGGLGSGVMAIAAGGSHTCALNTSGGAICWGANGGGQLGDGTTTQRVTPTPVSGLENGVAAITAGDSHTCALTTGGGVLCWGYNGYGQLGDGTTTQRVTPTPVSGLESGVTALTAGSGYTCALTTVGGVLCWGYNSYGQLGDGTTTQRNTPTPVGGLASGAAAITAGYYHTCALTTAGGAVCWGRNTEGQLGDGTTTGHNTPATVSGLGSDVAGLAAGGNHTCALTSAGGVVCWGTNWAGQLGDGTTTTRKTPTAVIGLGSGVAAISSKQLHSCALTTGGGVRCWGSDGYGQLGIGTRPISTSPLSVYGLGGSITVGTITPAHGLASGGTAVTITGTYFLHGATVMIGGTSVTNLTMVNTETITATTGARATGLADVVVQNPDGTQATLAGAFTYESAASGAVRGDFTGDGKSDILWRHTTGGDVWLWPMSGAAKVSETYVRTVADTNWEIRGQGDMNGDGKADILWRNNTTGQIYFWPMNGSTPVDEIYVATVDPVYDIVGTGDFNGDGKSDILWRHTTLGDIWIWLMDGPTPLSQTYVDTVDPAYVVKGVADLDNNTKADIIFHHQTLGEVWVWPMNGATRLSQDWVGTVPDVGYQIVGVADHTGDGKADLLWHHTTLGEVWIWTMNGPVRVAETWVGTVPDIGYQIVDSGDYDGDGMADILWHHATRGEVWVWLMDGTTKVSETWVATAPDTGYQIVKGK